jgi:hypothetical protein
MILASRALPRTTRAGGSPLASYPVPVPVQAVGVWGKDFEVPVRDVLAVQIGWGRGNAHRGIREIAPPRLARPRIGLRRRDGPRAFPVLPGGLEALLPHTPPSRLGLEIDTATVLHVGQRPALLHEPAVYLN